MQGLHSRAWDQSFSTNPSVDFSESQLRTPEGLSEQGGSDFCGGWSSGAQEAAPPPSSTWCASGTSAGGTNQQMHQVLPLPPGPEGASMCQPDLKDMCFCHCTAERSLHFPVKFFSSSPFGAWTSSCMWGLFHEGSKGGGQIPTA